MEHRSNQRKLFKPKFIITWIIKNRRQSSKKEVDSEMKHEFVEKDREIQAFKDELIKNSIRSWTDDNKE